MPCYHDLQTTPVVHDPYEVCPILENEHYRLRLVQMEDAPALLAVYADPAVWPMLNSDNCNSDFHFTTIGEMENYIRAWLDEYQKRYYVRFSIVDPMNDMVVGTIELFRREADDFFTDCGLLRLDLCRDHENAQTIVAILNLLIPHAFSLFQCHMLATKVPPVAIERQKAMEMLGFASTNEVLVGGHDSKRYGDYFVLFQ